MTPKQNTHEKVQNNNILPQKSTKNDSVHYTFRNVDKHSQAKYNMQIMQKLSLNEKEKGKNSTPQRIMATLADSKYVVQGPPSYTVITRQ